MFAAVAISAKMAYLIASVVEANILRIQRGYRNIGQHYGGLTPPLTQALGLIKLMRLCSGQKNGFVLAPLVFSGKFLLSATVEHALLAVLLFCVASSATYVMNDMHDVERDRQHPRKSNPSPCGRLVPMAAAVILLAILYAILIWHGSPLKVMVIISGYMPLNLAYTFVLKHQPVVDIFTIAIGFVLRVYAGAVALDVPLSTWMAITTLCLACTCRHQAAPGTEPERQGRSQGSGEILGLAGGSLCRDVRHRGIVVLQYVRDVCTPRTGHHDPAGLVRTVSLLVRGRSAGWRRVPPMRYTTIGSCLL
jgi:hypothetical protein